MSDKLKKLEYQKCLMEYNFLLTDFNYKNEVINEYTQDFYSLSSEKSKEEIKEKKEEEIPKIKIPETKKIEPKIKDSDLPTGSKEKIKKIYREIARLTHPDKVGNDEHIETYIRAKDAYESNDLMELYLICGELNILVDPDDQEIIVLKKLIEIKKEELKTIESSIIWKWIHSNDEKVKDELMKQFIKLRYGF